MASRSSAAVNQTPKRSDRTCPANQMVLIGSPPVRPRILMFLVDEVKMKLQVVEHRMLSLRSCWSVYRGWNDSPQARQTEVFPLRILPTPTPHSIRSMASILAPIQFMTGTAMLLPMAL